MFSTLTSYDITLRNIRNHIGKIVKTYKTDSFGNSLDTKNDKPRLLARYFNQFDLPLGFAGGLVDKDTGLIHFGYREYLPDVARWNRPDPLGKAGGDPDVYGYCLDDPVNVTDKSGLFLDGMFNFFSSADEVDNNATSIPELKTDHNPVKYQIEQKESILSKVGNAVQKTTDGINGSYLAKEGEEVYDPDPKTMLTTSGAMVAPPAAAAVTGMAAANAPAAIGTAAAIGRTAANAATRTINKVGEKGLELAVKAEISADNAGRAISSKVPFGKRLGRSLQKPIGTLTIEGLDAGMASIDGFPMAETLPGAAVATAKWGYEHRNEKWVHFVGPLSDVFKVDSSTGHAA